MGLNTSLIPKGLRRYRVIVRIGYCCLNTSLIPKGEKR